MDAYYSNNMAPANITKVFTKQQVQTQNITDDSDGFCICPNCFHFIFDELLTGICPCCHRRFCPSCSILKHRS